MFMDKKRRGMFGGVVVPGTPGIGDGIEERKQMEMGDPAPGLGMRGAPLPQQPTGFERPTGLRRAAGLFADFAAGLRGKEGQYAAMLEKRRETAAELANEQRKRSMGLEDYEARKQIDQRYPAPKDPYRWRNNDGDLMELGADGQPRKAYDDPTEKIDWIQVKDPVSGAISIFSRPRGGGMGDAPDELPADFDFGGGGASNGTSGFREAFAEWN